MRERQTIVCKFIKSSINKIFKGSYSSNPKKLPREYRERNYETPANLRPPNQDNEQSEIPETMAVSQQQNSLTWQPGYQLNNGDYTIERELGRGGFGITYLAQDRSGDRVVLKTLINQQEVQNREAWAEFWENLSNEAVQLAQCGGRNPYIVKLHRIMRERQLPCIVMEYIDGDTLSSLVKTRTLSEEEALLYIKQIGCALMEIHEQGLLHRDVKPHNIMIRRDGQGAVLIDFGIARKFVSGVTQTFLPAVTPGYAPIEQYEWRSRQDTYTDVYALAASLYYALTGENPITADRRADGTTLIPPKALNPNISDRVNQAIIHGMNLEGRDRPRSIQLFLKELLSDSEELKTLTSATGRSRRALNLELEYPKGPVEVDSPLYIKRTTVDDRCEEMILQSGALIRIKAPRLMGKTSLINRMLDMAAVDLHARTVQLNFLETNEDVLASLNRFLQWFCARTARELKLPHQLSERWDDFLPPTSNCTSYFEEYLLPSIHAPLVLSLDEVDRIFPYEKIAADFFALLRLWHEKGRNNATWKQLRLIVAHSAEVYIKLKTTQSPFNVGFLVELPEFTAEQVRELASRHQLDWDNNQVEKLMGLVGGHPYLVRGALYEIARQKLSLEDFLSQAGSPEGIYKDHLLRFDWDLQQEPELAKAFGKVLSNKLGIALENSYKQRLFRLGLIKFQGDKFQGDRAFPRCNLYRQYFNR